jgi:hypothetical protein
VANAINNQTKFMTSMLSEAEVRQSTAMSAHLRDLEQLQSEVGALRSAFKSTADGVLKQLERERLSISAVREAEHARVRELETRLRTIRLKQVELDARSSHQTIERENIARLEKQYLQKRREWDAELLSTEFDEGTMLRQRILQDVQRIKKERVNESYVDMVKLIEDGLRIVSDEVDHMRGEVSDLELLNRYLEARIQPLSSKRVTRPKSKSATIIEQAQMKVDELKRMRESRSKESSNVLT